jgi:23S rRNA (uridine2552-2'-O)-methyltransferase
MLEMKPIYNVNFIRGDINEFSSREQINKLITRADLVLSDIAPNITGIEDIDQANFVEIFESILEICSILLKKKGILVMKFFNGSSYDMVRNKLGRLFNKVNSFKPESSRSKSNEIFFICNGFKD